jgi:tetratricopeptide (TPR) repeat protein
MLECTRQILSLLALLTCGLAAAWGQPNWHERPTIYVPQKPPSKKELQRRESLKQYVLGLLYLHEDRLLDAVKALEKAIQLDPEATPIYKMLIPFYVALDRPTDALAATRKVLDQNPNDFETWFLYARQLKVSGQVKEARTALLRGLKAPGLKERPEVAQPMHLLLGMLYETDEDWLRAASAFAEAVKILDHPEPLLEAAPPLTREMLTARAAELLERIGGLYLKAKRFDDALAAYQQAQKRYPDGAGRINFNLAQVSQKQGNLAQAVIFLDAYLRLQPQGLEAYDLKIKLLQTLRRDGEILPWLEKASRADAFNVGLKMLLARTYAENRQGGQAEKVYQELAGKSPTAEVYRGLFRLYRDEKRLKDALDLINATLKEAKKEDPGPNPARPQADAIIAALRDDRNLAKDLVDVGYIQINRDRKLEFQTLHLLAILADRQRQLNKAKDFYRNCMKNYSPNTEALVYSGLLRVLWKAREYDEVIKLCRQGLKTAKFTKQTLFYGDLARALARQGKADEALTQADRGYDLAASDPERFSFRLLKVRILTTAERFNKAQTECQAMLKDFPLPGDVLETRYLLSGVYSAAKQFAKSEEQLELILKIDPDNATANNDLGYIWADQGKKLKEAEELIRKAIDLDRRQRKKLSGGGEENAAYIDSLGWVLFRRGQLDAARTELEKAIKLPEGDDPTIWDHLGDVYYRQGQAQRARTTWERARVLYERENSRTMDYRYKDLKRKIKLLDSVSN